MIENIAQKLAEKTCKIVSHNCSTPPAILYRLNPDERKVYITTLSRRTIIDINFSQIKRIEVHDINPDHLSDIRLERLSIECRIGGETLVAGEADIYQEKGDLIIIKPEDRCAIFVPKEAEPKVVEQPRKEVAREISWSPAALHYIEKKEELTLPAIDFSFLATTSMNSGARTAGLDVCSDESKLLPPPTIMSPERNTQNTRVATSLQEIETILNTPRKSLIKLGEALVDLGSLTTEQLNAALEIQRTQGHKPIGALLLDLGYITQSDLRLALAIQLGCPLIDISKITPDLAALRKIPIDLAKAAKALPLGFINGALVLAVHDVTDHRHHDDIDFHVQNRLIYTCSLNPLAVADIVAAYEHFGLATDKDPSSHELLSTLDETDSQEEKEEIEQNDNSLVKLVNAIITEAHAIGSSDIHFETYPGKRRMRVRFRKDGRMQQHMELPHTYSQAVVSRLKIMAELDISEKRQSQDGKIAFSKYNPACPIDLRVSTVPTFGGAEDVVLRLLGSKKALKLGELGFSVGNFERIKTAMMRPHGLILCAGPTGSGKTTTLHAILGELNTPDKKIWTAEDPVEITNPDFRQVQVNNKINWTFAKILRAFLRSDPDIIMVGEIRDEETATVAIEASLTGHLVLSTLHTNSAAETVTRLLDMGVDQFSFSDSLSLVIAQRLVRQICPQCKQKYAMTAEELDLVLEDFAAQFFERPNPDRIKAELLAHCGGDRFEAYKPIGCKACDHTGYSGRIGLHEVLLIDRNLRRLVQKKASPDDIQALAYTSTGFRNLRQDGILKVLLGNTTMDEVRSGTA